jgi:CRISPR-associated protein Csd1
MQRLLCCRIDQAAFPLDIMQALVSKAGNLQVYKTNRNKLLCITCAVVRKYYIDHKKEEFKLALEPERMDRSYQWGRMLAVMEKIERDTYDLDEKREPNAIRMQSVFVKRPGYAFAVIMEQLKNAYYPRLHVGLRTKYERLIGEIMEQLHLSLKEPDDYGKLLTESYLPGYYLQKSELYTKKENEETEEHTDEV